MTNLVEIMLVYVFATLSYFVDSKVKLCKNTNICPAGYLCCESLNYTQWCCSDEQFCCPHLNGCCSATSQAKKSFSNHSNYFHNQETKVDAYGLLNTSKLTINGNFSDHNLEPCDNELSILCGIKGTCCPAKGSWYCCPANTSCCENDVPCCSTAATSDTTKHARQKLKSHRSSALEKAPLRKNLKTNSTVKTSLTKNLETNRTVKQRFILCPDDMMICMDTNTYCLITNDTYGCCPYQDVVCCPDLVHCCPPNTMCNLETFFCEDDSRRLAKRMHKVAKRYL